MASRRRGRQPPVVVEEEAHEEGPDAAAEADGGGAVLDVEGNNSSSEEDSEEEEEEEDDDEEEEEEEDTGGEGCVGVRVLESLEKAVVASNGEPVKPYLPTCPICMEIWASDGAHRVCCIPCGHVYGRSCLEKWLQYRRRRNERNVRCPQCGRGFTQKNIINLYTPEIVVPNNDLEKEVLSLKEQNESLRKENKKLVEEISEHKRQIILQHQTGSLDGGSSKRQKMPEHPLDETMLVGLITPHATFCENELLSQDAVGASNLCSFVLQMSTSNAPAPTDTDPKMDPNRKAKSKDPGWKYGWWPDLNNKNVVQCMLCDKPGKGGIHRLKQHLVGGFKNIVKCPNTTTTIAQEMLKSMEENSRAKLHVGNEDNVAAEDQQVGEQGEVQTVGSNTMSSLSNKRKFATSTSHLRGPLDNLVRRTPEQVVDDRRGKGSSQTTIENRFRTPEDRKKVNTHIANWWYECGIPFNAAKKRSFEVMCESIAQYGPGYKPPSYHELRVPLLEESKKDIDDAKDRYMKYWKKHGCTLMSDGWTDTKFRHLINFMVNCPEGTFFLESVDASSFIQDKQLMFNLLDSKIQEIGPDYVVQVVTDNASTYQAAGRMLEEKYPKLFWTPCAAHCIDLMLEDIGKMKKYLRVISKGKQLTTFIYKHYRLLAAMRETLDGRDLVRHAITRFATSFLTLRSLYMRRDGLRELFSSDFWRNCKLARTEAGKRVTDIIFSVSFWNGVEDSLKACQPLLIVLRIADGDERPTTPEIFVAIEHAKKKIMENFGNKENLYKKIIRIVDCRWETQMGHPLYKAALFLNPDKYFDYARDNPDEVWTIRAAFQDVLSKMVPDRDIYDKILKQSIDYKTGRAHFGRIEAVRNQKKFTPIDWWGEFGGPARELSDFATRILGLCCSASGCERCWSTFGFNELYLDGARLMGIDASSQIVFASRRSPRVGGEHVLTKVSMFARQEVQDIQLPTNTKAIRDICILPSGCAVFASLGRRLSLFSMTTNSVVLQYDLPAPGWSCAGDITSSNHIYAGLQNGMVLVFDIRQTALPLHTKEGLSAHPVHTIHSVMDSGGSRKVLSASSIGPCIWDVDGRQSRPSLLTGMENQGVCISLARAPPPNDLLVASFRPRVEASNDATTSQMFSSQSPISSSGKLGCHTLIRRTNNSSFCKGQFCYGNVSELRMSKSAIIPCGNNQQLFAYGDESLHGVRTWLLPSFQSFTDLMPHQQPILDLRYAEGSTGERYLGCLSEDKLQIFRISQDSDCGPRREMKGAYSTSCMG